MFYTPRRRGPLAAIVATAELIHHTTVRSIRQGHRNAFYGLLINVLQTAALMLVFYILMQLIRQRVGQIRGDFFLYMMTGIITYMTHTKTMGAVARAGSSTGAMQLHGPMTTAVAIASGALSALYLQIVTMGVLLYAYHVIMNPITIEEPIPALGLLMIAWAYGIGLGLIVLAIRPWSPRAATIIQQLYARVSMIASGKMFVANTLSYTLLKYFEWNPLFHLIDQMRGFVFINYVPHHTNWQYPLMVTPVVILIGLMGEFYTRRHASRSWSAGG